VTWEDDVQVFIGFAEAEEDARWAQADHAWAMTRRWGRQTATRLASEVGHSASYIRQLVATAKAFADPATRAQDLSFSHHRIAEMTQDPDFWIDQAAAHQWSVAELRQAIRDAKDAVADAERARRARERVEQAVRKYNEQWASVTGQRAVLVWTVVSQARPTDALDSTGSRASSKGGRVQA